jgi:hypothetical protein
MTEPMVDALSPLGGYPPATGVPQPPASGSPKLSVVPKPTELEPTELPPAEVLDALDTAARVLDELDRSKIALRVERDPVTHQIRAQIRDLATGEEREIPARKLLNILSGDLQGLAVDTRG